MMLRASARALVASPLEPVFRAGDTFPHDPAITEEKAQVAWAEQTQGVGTLPGAVRYQRLGYVDALVMVPLQACHERPILHAASADLPEGASHEPPAIGFQSQPPTSMQTRFIWLCIFRNIEH
jgi:hypothetical protein